MVLAACAFILIWRWRSPLRVQHNSCSVDIKAGVTERSDSSDTTGARRNYLAHIKACGSADQHRLLCFVSLAQTTFDQHRRGCAL